MTYSDDERQRIIKGLRGELTQTEIGRMRSNAQTGVFHLRLAIEAFDGLQHGTDTGDLREFLVDAEDVLGILSEAVD